MKPAPQSEVAPSTPPLTGYAQYTPPGALQDTVTYAKDKVRSFTWHIFQLTLACDCTGIAYPDSQVVLPREEYGRIVCAPIPQVNSTAPTPPVRRNP